MEFLTNVDFGMRIMNKIKLSLLSYVIACITFLDTSSLVAQDMDSREGDSLALVALYNSTNGPGWSNNDNWLTDSPINLWETTSGLPPVTLIDGRVIELFLEANNLEGPIPPEIGNLTKLKVLSLIRNKLNDTIPKELGRLTKLEFLLLQNNNLTGNIPKELSMLSGLGHLSLIDNNLDGTIPPELGELDKLGGLLLSNNNLSGEIPKELGNISNLQVLYLNRNNLTGSIPVELAIPERMQTLDLSDNDLDGIIHSELGSIKNLFRLGLSNNKFSTIENLDISSGSAFVDVDGNRIGFSSIVPNMNGLYTYNNQIVDGRDTVTGTETRSIALTISDDHPDNSYQWYKDGNSVVVDTNRRYVISDLSFADAGKYYASITNTNFPLDTFWRDTIDLEVITLYMADSLTLVDLYNSMGGSKWSDNTNWLSVNPIDTWAGVTATNRVDELDLEDNNLVGVIPSTIGYLDELRRLDLSNNNLMGSVPLELSNLSDLIELRLNDNNLTGFIPLGLGDLENLKELRLNNNRLTGTIPSGLGSLASLEELRLNNNSLTGSIPLELRNLTNIEILFFQNNELDSIEDISSLPTDAVVDIENNKIGFLSIVPNIGVIDSYDNQLLDTKYTIYANSNDKLSLTVSDDHEDNSYQWHKDDELIENATNRIYSIDGFEVENAGEYYATIQNTKAPVATSRRETISVVINRILEFDSLALVSFYKSTNGDGWSNNDNWLSASTIDSWHGVTIENNRVVSLELSNNNLTGTIPSSINDLSALQLLNVSDNEISSIDDIGSVPMSANVSISNNKIGFVSIVPNMLLIDSYEGQVIDDVDTFRIIVGGSLSLSISDDHPDNSYQWYKDGNSIAGAIDRVYTIGNVRLSNSGVYYASIDNNATQSNTMILRDSIYVFINDTITTDPIDTLSSMLVPYSSLSAYPNPVRDILYIANQSNDEIQLSIKINTIEGKLVLHKSDIFIRDRYGIDVSKLSSGIYYVHLMYGSQISTIKIVKE